LIISIIPETGLRFGKPLPDKNAAPLKKARRFVADYFEIAFYLLLHLFSSMTIPMMMPVTIKMPSIP